MISITVIFIVAVIAGIDVVFYGLEHLLRHTTFIVFVKWTLIENHAIFSIVVVIITI